MDKFDTDLDTFIRKRLRELNMSISELMRQTGLTRKVYYDLTGGKTDQARLGTIFKLASVLRVHPLMILRRMLVGYEDLAHTELTTLYAGDVTGFVQDVTIPDNTPVVAGQVFEKQWEIQNLGKVAWHRRRLVCMDEPVLFSIRADIIHYEQVLLKPHQDSIEIPDTLPNETVVLSVTFTAPDFPGTMRSYWKMVDQEGRLCFPENQGLFCQVKVIAI